MPKRQWTSCVQWCNRISPKDIVWCQLEQSNKMVPKFMKAHIKLNLRQLFYLNFLKKKKFKNYKCKQVILQNMTFSTQVDDQQTVISQLEWECQPLSWAVTIFSVISCLAISHTESFISVDSICLLAIYWVIFLVFTFPNLKESISKFWCCSLLADTCICLFRSSFLLLWRWFREMNYSTSFNA